MMATRDLSHVTYRGGHASDIENVGVVCLWSSWGISGQKEGNRETITGDQHLSQLFDFEECARMVKIFYKLTVENFLMFQSIVKH